MIVRRVIGCALLATAAQAFTMLPATAPSVQGSSRAAVTSRPALRGGLASLKAVYEPSLCIGHGFDIHRLGERVQGCLKVDDRESAFTFFCIVCGLVVLSALSAGSFSHHGI